MPLQIRRGIEAERTQMSVPLAQGELLYVTNQGKLYVGDGATLGGILITGFTAEESQDATGSLFTTGNHTNINFTYGGVQDAANRIDASIDLTNYSGNINLSGNLVVSGDLRADGIKSSIFADDSTLLVDAISGSIAYSVITGGPTLLSQFTNDVGYIRVADIADGTVTIDVNNTGDLQGSVFGDDSTLLVDAVNSLIPAEVLTGTFTGNLIGSIQTNSIQSPNANPIVMNSVTQFNDLTRISASVEQFGGHLQIESFINTSFPTNLVLRKNRGTSTAPLSAQNGDFIGQIQFNAFDGVGITSGAVISARITDTVAAGRVPTGLGFFTMDSAGVMNESLSISKDGGVEAYTTSKALSPFRLLSSIQDDVGSNYILLDRNRGTRGSPQSLNSEDTIWGVGYRGYDGTKYVVSGIVSTAVDGPINTGQFYSIPGRIEFRNVDLAGDLDIRMVLSSEGILKVRALGGIEVNDAYIQNWIQFDVMPRLPDFADESAANASIDGLDPVGISPNEMNGMMYYDTALGKIRGRAGGVWVDLH